jgi:hypothetical protein
MNMKILNQKILALIVAPTLLLGFSLNPAHAAAPKAGSKCTKLGAKQSYSGAKFTCTKTGKKLVWKKIVSQPAQKSNSKINLEGFIQLAKAATANTNNQIPTIDDSGAVSIRNVSSNSLKNFVVANSLSKINYLGPTPLAETDSNRIGTMTLATKNQRFVYNSYAAAPPWGAAFDFNTSDPQGRLVVKTSGQSLQNEQNYSWRLVFKNSSGSWKYQSPAGISHSTNGQEYFDEVSLGAPGKYSIHLEFDSKTIFYGIGIADEVTSITSASPNLSPRVIILGDSFVYPVLNEQTPFHVWDAFPGALSWLTGWNVISAGVPGQGYLHPAAGEIYKDRVVRDLLPQNPDVIIFTGSPNDRCRECTYSDQEIATEMGNDVKLLQAANPNVLIILCSPFQSSVQQSDAMRLVAKDLHVAFVDFNKPRLLEPGTNGPNPLVPGHPSKAGSRYIAEQMLKRFTDLVL